MSIFTRLKIEFDIFVGISLVRDTGVRGSLKMFKSDRCTLSKPEEKRQKKINVETCIAINYSIVYLHTSLHLVAAANRLMNIFKRQQEDFGNSLTRELFSVNDEYYTL